MEGLEPLRQLLLLTQHFPPSGEIAGRVTARLLRHLPSFGWQTTVLTIGEPAIVGPIDRAAYGDVLASLQVERVARWPRALDLLAKARPRPARAAAEPAPTQTSAPAAFSRSADVSRSRLVRYLTFPDKQAGWVAPAVMRARQLLRARRADALLTISPPHSTHLAGLALHRLFPDVPWIAQLHDPWVPFDDPPPDWALARGAGYLERQVFSAASEVLLATDEARSRYLVRYPELPPRKLGVLVNGYDPVDFPPATAPEAGQTAAGARPLRFVHLGTIYGARDPRPFLSGLASLISTGALDRRAVQVQLIGDCEPLAAVNAAVAAGGLEGVVTITGPIDHAQALARMVAADVLLLLAQEQPYQIPAKLYEYLHAHRFVLAFTDGASARVIQETGAGRVVGPGQDALPVLRDIVELHRAGQLARWAAAPQKLAPYQARHLAGLLAGRLNAVAGESEARRRAAA
ncbi:MAG: glycosyltransferase [Pseudomonadota bacterium]